MKLKKNWPKTVKPSTFKNNASFLMHTGAALGVTAGTLFLLKAPIISGLSFAIVMLVNTKAAPALKRALERALPEEEDLSDSERLQQGQRTREIEARLDNAVINIEDYSQKMGIAPPHLHCLDGIQENSRRMEEQSELVKLMRKFLMFFDISHIIKENFNDSVNAFALKGEDARIVVSEPLLNKLNDNELNGVTGHETGHIAGKHNLKGSIVGATSSIGSTATSIALIATYLSSLKNVGLMTLNSIISKKVGNVCAHIMNLDPENSDKDKATKEKIGKITRPVSAITTGLTFGAPEIVAAVVLNVGVKQVSAILKSSYSKSNEYNADESSALATGHPEWLISALHKIRDRDSASPFEAGVRKKSKKENIIKDMYRKTSEIYLSHPSVENRCNRLQRIADKYDHKM